MRMPPVGQVTVVEAEPGYPGGVQLLIEAGPAPRLHLAVVLDARQTRQLAEQLLFVVDGSVIVATNRPKGY